MEGKRSECGSSSHCSPHSRYGQWRISESQVRRKMVVDTQAVAVKAGCCAMCSFVRALL